MPEAAICILKTYAPLGASTKEEPMSRVLVVVLITVLSAVTFAAQTTTKVQKTKTTTVKETRWDGIIVRHNESTFTVRKRGSSLEKDIVYSSTTKWTKLNKPAEMGLFKDGERIIAV